MNESQEPRSGGAGPMGASGPLEQAKDGAPPPLPVGQRAALFAAALAMIGVAIWLLTPPSERPLAAAQGANTAPARPAARFAALRAGAKLPPVTITTIDGAEVRLDEMKGKRLLINFWATWCPPCRAELPDLARVYQEQPDPGVEILAVDVKESPGQIRDFLADTGALPFRIGLDKDGAQTDLFAVNSLPTSVFVDDEGVIRLTFTGGMNYSTIQRKLQQVLDEQDYARSQNP